MTLKQALKRTPKATMARIKVQGWSSIDRRSAGYRAAMQWKRELLTSLGAESNLSCQELMLVEMCVRDRMLLDSFDIFIMQLASPINKKKRQAYAIVSQRMAIADALARRLASLGLKRRLPEPPSLAKYLQDTYGSGQDDPDTEAEHMEAEETPTPETAPEVHPQGETEQ